MTPLQQHFPETPIELLAGYLHVGEYAEFRAQQMDIEINLEDMFTVDRVENEKAADRPLIASSLFYKTVDSNSDLQVPTPASGQFEMSDLPGS